MSDVSVNKDKMVVGSGFLFFLFNQFSFFKKESMGQLISQ